MIYPCPLIHDLQSRVFWYLARKSSRPEDRVAISMMNFLDTFFVHNLHTYRIPIFSIDQGTESSKLMQSCPLFLRKAQSLIRSIGDNSKGREGVFIPLLPSVRYQSHSTSPKIFLYQQDTTPETPLAATLLWSNVLLVLHLDTHDGLVFCFRRGAKRTLIIMKQALLEDHALRKEWRRRGAEGEYLYTSSPLVSCDVLPDLLI